MFKPIVNQTKLSPVSKFPTLHHDNDKEIETLDQEVCSKETDHHF